MGRCKAGQVGAKLPIFNKIRGPVTSLNLNRKFVFFFFNRNIVWKMIHLYKNWLVYGKKTLFVFISMGFFHLSLIFIIFYFSSLDFLDDFNFILKNWKSPNQLLESPPTPLRLQISASNKPTQSTNTLSNFT